MIRERISWRSCGLTIFRLIFRLLAIIKKEALEVLLASGADNPVPWYGQLMTTPQTIAWFLQVNYWMKKYRVELV